MTTTYGILSDFHAIPPGVLIHAIGVLKNEGAEKLILNGDIVGERFPAPKKQLYLAALLDICAQSGLQIYAQPGSHEEVLVFQPVLEAYAAHYGKITNIFEQPKISHLDHDLVFLPGSRHYFSKPMRLNGYMIDKVKDVPSGFCKSFTKSQMPSGVSRLTNLNDLTKLVSDPEKTIVLCHDPPRFTHNEHAPDCGYYAHRHDGTIIEGVFLEEIIAQKIAKEFGNIAPTPEVVHMIAAQDGFTFKRINVGSSALSETYKELGIRKAINGHVHSAVHHATDSQGNPVAENTFLDELFWNASYMDEGKMGLLTVDGTKVAYENIDLTDYL